MQDGSSPAAGPLGDVGANAPEPSTRAVRGMKRIFMGPPAAVIEKGTGKQGRGRRINRTAT